MCLDSDQGESILITCMLIYQAHLYNSTCHIFIKHMRLYVDLLGGIIYYTYLIHRILTIFIGTHKLYVDYLGNLGNLGNQIDRSC